MGRLTLSNGCVSRLKEVRARTVGFVRKGSVRSMFDAMFDVRCDVRSSARLVNKEARNTCKGGRSDFLNEVAN